MKSNKVITFLGIACFTLLSSSCVKLPAPTTTISLPPTQQVQITFQNDDIPADCRVFSHRLTYTPAGATGSQIHDNLVSNAKTNGADMILIGLVREQPEAELENYQFYVYGPSTPYLFQSRWSGWRFGFKDWRKQGEIIDFGVDSLNNDKIDYRQGLIMQNIYLTCRPLQ